MLWLACMTVQAQEFFIEVKVQAPEVQTNDRQVFTQLEQVVRDLVNNRAWTEGTWEQDERIRGSLVLTIRDYDQSSGHVGQPPGFVCASRLWRRLQYHYTQFSGS